MGRQWIDSEEGWIEVEEVANAHAILGSPNTDWGTAIDPDSADNVLGPGDPRRLEIEGFQRGNWKFFDAADSFMEDWRGGHMQDPPESLGRVYRYQDRLLVGTPEIDVLFRNGVSDQDIDALLGPLGATQIWRSAGSQNLFTIEVGHRDAFDVADTLRQNAGAALLWAEPVLMEVIVGHHQPTDPMFKGRWGFDFADIMYEGRWHLENTGVEWAWKHTRGAGIRIGIIDWGFDVDHPDLEDAVSPESAYWNVATGAWSTNHATFPDADHGTQCAGIAGGRQKKWRGVLGVAPGSELLLMGLVAASTGGSSTLVQRSNAIARGIEYAVNKNLELSPDAKPYIGADVISCALGYNGTSVVTNRLRNALKFAARKARNELGVPVFWALGNSDTYLVATDKIASNKHTIAVGSLESVFTRWNHAWGVGLDFLAPGRDLMTTDGAGDYTLASGCSIAASYAAAAAALVLSVKYDLTAGEVRRLLRMTCEKVGIPFGAVYGLRSEWSENYGWGRVSPGAAVERALWLRQTGFPV